MPTTTFLCPYCFEVNDLRSVKYFCKRCNADKTVTRKGISALNRYAARASTLCPDCGTSAMAVCPNSVCHHKLPEGTLTGTNSIISIVGGRAAGKTHFVGVLIYELARRIAADFQASFVGFDESRMLWEREFGSLYHTLQALELTRVGEHKEPLIYEFVVPSRFGNKMYTFAFFDTAGENFNDEGQMSVLNKYIYQSAGIIFLFDPLQIPMVAAQVPSDVLTGSTAGAGGGTRTSNSDVLAHVANLIWGYRGQKRGQRISTPAAVVFTKLDAIADILPPGSAVLDNSPHAGQVMLNDLHNVSNEIESLLKEWDEAAFVQQVNNTFPEHGYFAVSALGIDNHPDATANRSVKKPQPHRIEDPFLWMLTKTGVLKGRK